MRELIEQVPEGEHDTIGPNDIFSQVMGKEKIGRVRMCGLGACPSDVGVQCLVEELLIG